MKMLNKIAIWPLLTNTKQVNFIMKINKYIIIIIYDKQPKLWQIKQIKWGSKLYES